MDGNGDIFGDFVDYLAADWGMDIDCTEEDDSRDLDASSNFPSTLELEIQFNDDDFDPEDEDLYVATMAEEELGMEPERAPYHSSPTQPSPMTVSDGIHTTTGKASRL